MRVLFMGTPDFAVPSLTALIASSHEVAAVLTGEDKPRGRGRTPSPTPVKQAAMDAGIPVMEISSPRDPALPDRLRAWNADLFVVVAFRILPPEVFTIPPCGTFNLHASLLPRYRGAAPINWALMHGETRTGVTTFFLRETVDTGSMILQREVDIPRSMTAGELHDVLAVVGAEAVVTTVDRIAAGGVIPVPQDDALASPAPKIFREHCAVDWSMPAARVHDFIRGLSPVPGAWTHHDATLLKLQRSEEIRAGAVQSDGPTAPGTVLRADRELWIMCGDGPVRMLTLQQEGRASLSADAFLRGYSLRPGDVLV